MMRAFIGVLGILIAGVVGLALFFRLQLGTPTSVPASTAPTASEKPVYNSAGGVINSPPVPPEISQHAWAMSNVKLTTQPYKDPDDVIMKATFTIQNDSDYTLKDFEIKCIHHAASGTQIDSNTRTIYEILKPHSKRRFPMFNMGFVHPQVRSTHCEIVNLAIVGGP